MKINQSSPVRFAVKVTSLDDGFDPGGDSGDIDASRSAYQAQISEEIKKEFPGAEVTHFTSFDQYGAPESWSIKFEDDRLDSCHGEGMEICNRVQEIMEEVYETGNFWC